MVEQLIRIVKTWDTSTQSDEANQTVAAIVRSITLHLWNEHGKLDFSIQITAALRNVFQGMSDITHLLHQDLKTLETIKQRQKSADTGCLWKIVIYIGIGLPFLIGALLQGC